MRRMFLLMKKWNVCVWDWKSCVRHTPELLFLLILSGQMWHGCVWKNMEWQSSIAAGEMDADMFRTVAELNVPYIMMHMQGTPQNMQKHPHYDNLLKEIFLYFAQKVQQLRDLGMKDIILDPGFGFGKTVEHNYELLAHLEEFRVFELPLLVGVSRKSMIYRLLGGTPQGALNGTTVLDTICLLKGADILRVHDVREAVETVKIVEAMRRNGDKVME